MTIEAVDTRVTDSAVPTGRLPLPAAVTLRRIDWLYGIMVIVYHLVAMLALLPWFFSWTGVILFILGDYVFGVLGINLCYHRLLTHRGFKCPKWFEHFLVILAICCVQDTPARWVAVHRRHHQHADDPADPHSPSVSLFWGHMGWLLVENPELNRLRIFDRYAKDILCDRFYVWLERNYRQGWVIIGSWFLFLLGGFVAELLLGGTTKEAVQFGVSLLIWGVFVRTVVVWHQTWAVNSVTHRWGYRNYATDEGSRNNLFVGIISNGEGWHNNHHADQRSAKHGHRWWELDTTYLIIRFLRLVGLARDVAVPSPHIAAARAVGRLTTRGGAAIPTD